MGTDDDLYIIMLETETDSALRSSDSRNQDDNIHGVHAGGMMLYVHHHCREHDIWRKPSES